jgi:hypothetical protein
MMLGITLCTWNVCLGSRNKLNLIADFIAKNNIYILHLQEAEILEDINTGYLVETEISLPNQIMRTSMYIRSRLK